MAIHSRTAARRAKRAKFTGQSGFRSPILAACGLGAFLVASLPLAVARQKQQPASTASTVRFARGGNAAEVPMELAANAVFVPVRIGGQRPSSWLLDTASKVTVADPRLAQAAQTDQAGHSAMLELPGLAFPESDLTVHSLENLGPWYGLHVGGVLGEDHLGGVVAELDYSRLSIEFYDPGSYGRPRHMKKLTVLWVNGLPTVRAALRLGGATFKGNFVLNTASSAGVVAFRAFLTPRREPLLAGKTIPGKIIGASGVRGATLRRGDWFDLSSMRVSRPVVAIIEPNAASSPLGAIENLKKNSVAGWIGGGILRKFRVVLDFPQNRVYVAANRDFVFPILADASGATITATGSDLDQFEVRGVRAGSPAAKAGLDPGDRIVVIDGEKASDLSLDQIRDLLSQAGHSPVLAVERLGKRVRINLQLKPSI